MSGFRVRPPFGESFDRMDAAAARNAGGLCTRATVQSDGSMSVTNAGSNDAWQTRAALSSAFGRKSVEEVRHEPSLYHSAQEQTHNRDVEAPKRFKATERIGSSKEEFRRRVAFALWKEGKVSGAEVFKFLRVKKKGKQ